MNLGREWRCSDHFQAEGAEGRLPDQAAERTSRRQPNVAADADPVDAGFSDRADCLRSTPPDASQHLRRMRRARYRLAKLIARHVSSRTMSGRTAERRPVARASTSISTIKRRPLRAIMAALSWPRLTASAGEKPLRLAACARQMIVLDQNRFISPADGCGRPATYGVFLSRRTGVVFRVS